MDENDESETITIEEAEEEFERWKLGRMKEEEIHDFLYIMWCLIEQTQNDRWLRLILKFLRIEQVKMKVEYSEQNKLGEKNDSEPRISQLTTPKISEEKMTKIIELKSQGYSLRRIGNEVGIPKSTVHLLLQKMQQSNQ